MNLNRYPFYTNNYKVYEFYSEGPNGRVRKSVIFEKIQDNPTVYNIAFGDQDPLTNTFSDTVITDNKDRDMVLATVANTIHSFCDHYGNYFIYAEGSTPVRTRLYQISLSRIWDEINIDFEIYGVLNNEVYRFQKNVNYDGFFIKRK